jgi:AraC-like DNA-binding protein
VQPKTALMKYTVYPPPESLRNYVEHLWTIAVQGAEPPDLTLKFFVTCAPCIVFQHHNGRSAIARRNPASSVEVCNRNHPTSFVRGAITRPFQCVAEGPPTAIGVELKPQALTTLLGINAAELTDGIVDLDALSTENLNEQLLNADTQRDQIALVTQFLKKRADTSPPVDLLVAESLRLIHGNTGSIHVRDLLKRLNVSERQFERRFSRAVGISPSRYLRITRFQEAVRLMKACRAERLSDIAYDLGYTDESHFIKDTREFTGYTPKSLSHTVEECVTMTRYRTLVRQRILIQQDTCEAKFRTA